MTPKSIPADDIQEEVWANREALGAQFGFDLHAIGRYLREQERASGRVVLQPPPQPPPDAARDAAEREAMSEPSARG